jgi:hypothetical protein
MMQFDDITKDGRLWSVRYEGEDDNALFQSFAQWNDVEWLRNFLLDEGIVDKDGFIDYQDSL